MAFLLHTEVFTNILDLTPFWISKSYYWSSSYVRETGSLRYTYPEFNDLKLGDLDAVQIAIANYVDQKYGDPKARGGSPGTGTQPAASGTPAPAAQGMSLVTASVLLSHS